MTSFILQNTETFQVTRENGMSYDVYIRFPNGDISTPRPKKGYPVVYLLDGSATFPIAISYYNLVRSAPKKDIRPTEKIIVGISAHDDSPFSDCRKKDFTPKAIPEKMPQKFAKLAIAPEETGGISDFSEFIEQEIKPLIEANYFVNKDNQTLVGHSLGGLFATYILLNQRTLYQHYVIGSPSLWWNDGELLTQSETFTKGKETVKILVGTGEPKFMQERAQKLEENLASKLSNTFFTLCKDKNHLDMMFEMVFQVFK